MAFIEKAVAFDEDKCLPWPYGKINGTYATITIKRRSHLVSRLVCERVHGAPLISGLEAIHSCRTTHCINPRHLRWGTHSQNMQDRVRDGTSNRGERSHTNKLTTEQVKEIRLLVQFPLTDNVIADHYGVARETIAAIRTGINWAWLK